MKKWIMLASITIVLIIIILLLYNTVSIKNRKINISGDVVNNNYNNYIANQYGNERFCRIDDKLYFNYYKNDLNFGIIEISENGTNRIYWEGIQFGLFTSSYMEPFVCDNEILFRRHGSNNIEYWDFKSSEFILLETSKELNIEREFQIIGDAIYYLTPDSSEENWDSRAWNLIKDQSGKSKLLVKNIINFYMYENKIIYNKYESGGTGEIYSIEKEEWQTTNENCCLYEYDIGTEENKKIFEGKMSPNIIIVEKGYAIFKDTSEHICKIKIDGTEKIQTIIKENNVSRFNVFDGKIYLNMENGFKIIDIDSNIEENFIPVEYKPNYTYIVDDKWIYFTTNDFGDASKLMRVSNDGETIEIVFD